MAPPFGGARRTTSTREAEDAWSGQELSGDRSRLQRRRDRGDLELFAAGARHLAADVLQAVVAPQVEFDADGARTHHQPRAKRVVQLFMAGGASHVDLFDFKPELVKRHGEEANFGEHVEAFQNGLGPWLKPVWEFKPYGQTGNIISAAAPVFAVMLIGRVVASLAHGAFFGIGSVVAAELVAPQRKAAAISLMFTGLTVANVVGVPMGTLVGHTAGWRMTFLVVAALGAVGLWAFNRKDL